MENIKKKLYFLISNIYLIPLNKLNNRLVMSSDSSYKFYEKYIRWQLSNAIIYLLYENYSYLKSLKLIWDSRVLISSSVLVSFMMCFTYYVGASSTESEIISKNALIEAKSQKIESLIDNIHHNRSIINKIQNKITKLYSFKKSRSWLEYEIYSKTDIDKFSMKMKGIDDDILLLMSEQANKYDIPYSIYFRLIDTESTYKFVANKKSGAFGYMQIMPITFKSYYRKLKLKGGHNKRNNILVGSYMLYTVHKQWIKRGKDDYSAWEYTLAEYNAGRGKMQIKKNDKVMGYQIPSYTRKYINSIMKTYNEEVD